jgi:hypothetical protein
MRRILAQKRGFQESTQFPLPEQLSRLRTRHVLVLTEKTGLFLGVLAAKTMFWKIKIEFAFEFWRFFKIFRVASYCGAVITIDPDPPKKIIPKSLR